jgi:putative membrane protein insertion efficiency factor
LKLSRIPANILIALLRGYKRVLSPVLLPACRYTPTCSEYALEAVDQHGAVKGSTLAIWRLLRCHPFTRGGYDPVPHACVGRTFLSDNERSHQTSA